jgi:hypothetical protein
MTAPARNPRSQRNLSALSATVNFPNRKVPTVPINTNSPYPAGALPFAGCPICDAPPGLTSRNTVGAQTRRPHAYRVLVAEGLAR